MSCVPILGRKKRYHFEAVVRLHKLISVPYVNAVTFAKLRLLNTRHSSQYSPRAETHNHTVSWDTEHRFLCRFESNPETNILEPKILKISIRMETKGGKSFNKVGFVSVNLACFAGMGNVVSRRRYILEGYDERHKRQDNSLLLLSFSMRQLFGDTCFRIPTENLSKCLMEPSDSEEVEAVGPDGCCANVNSYADLMNSELLPEGRRSFDRVLHSLNLDPLVVASQNSKSTPSLQLTQQNPAVATFLANAVNATENGRRPLFPIPVNSSLSPDQLVTLLTGVFPSQQLAPAAEEIRSELSRSPMCDTLGAAIDRSVCKSVTQEDSGRTKHYAKGCSSDRDPHCSVTLEHPITEASPPLLKQMQTFEERGADRQESEMGRTQHTTVFSAGVPSEDLLGSDKQPSSDSTTPDSTAANSPAIQVTNLCPILTSKSSPYHQMPATFSTVASTINDPTPSTVVQSAIRDVYEDAFCHSLPLPSHYSARHKCELPSSLSPVGPRLPRSKHSEYFATDSGLILPSRRRKIRPVADFSFPPSHMCPVNSAAHECSTLSSAYASNSAVIPENKDEQQSGPLEPRFTPHCSSIADSRSSGYQSHSRQSSLESQPVVSASALSATSVVNVPTSSISDTPYVRLE